MKKRSNKRKTAPVTVRTVTFKDCAAVIGLPLEKVAPLVASIGIEVLLGGVRNEESIAHSDFILFANDSRVQEAAALAARNDAELRLKDETSGANHWFRSEASRMLAGYQADIAILESVHAKYLEKVNLSSQSGVAAAYILCARALNLLNMGCASLGGGYWNSGILLRQIDETIHLAEYFARCDPASNMSRDLNSWYIENRTPEPIDVRRALADQHSRDFGSADVDAHLSTMNELYGKKSKWIHPAYPPIKETFRTFPIARSAEVIGFDYGASSYPRKLHELIVFFESSLWSTVQAFALCFQQQLPLSPDDIETLGKLDRKFLEHIEQRRD